MLGTSVTAHPAASHSHGPLIVAHRGASYYAPENTLAAFRLAWEQGADAIEGDFFLTADGQILCLHDKDFKRVSGDPRPVVELTAAEARKLDVGTWKDPRFAGERAPFLSEILAIVPEGKLFLMEIKCGPEIIPEFKRVIEASGVPLSRLRVISFNAEVIAESKKQIPALKAYWLTSFKKDAATGVYAPTVAEILATLKRTQADGLDCKAEMNVVDEAFVKAFRDQGYEMHTWTVNDPEVARKVARLGFDSITTDRPAFIRAELAKP